MTAISSFDGTLLFAYFLLWFPSGRINATRRMFKGRKEPGIADVCVCTFHPHSSASVSHLMEEQTEAGRLVHSSGGRAPSGLPLISWQACCDHQLPSSLRPSVPPVGVPACSSSQGLSSGCLHHWSCLGAPAIHVPRECTPERGPQVSRPACLRGTGPQNQVAV